MKFSRTALTTLSATALGFLALSLGSIPAAAGTASTTFAVNATVSATCLVSANSLAFNTYAFAQLDASTTLSVTCTNNTGYSVGLDAGKNSSDPAARKMKGALTGNTDLLTYALYQGSAGGTLWDNNTNTLKNQTGSGSAQSIPVWGRIPAGQYVQPDTYTDTITVSVNY